MCFTFFTFREPSLIDLGYRVCCLCFGHWLSAPADFRKLVKEQRELPETPRVHATLSFLSGDEEDRERLPGCCGGSSPTLRSLLSLCVFEISNADFAHG